MNLPLAGTMSRGYRIHLDYYKAAAGEAVASTLQGKGIAQPQRQGSMQAADQKFFRADLHRLLISLFVSSRLDLACERPGLRDIGATMIPTSRYRSVTSDAWPD